MSAMKTSIVDDDWKQMTNGITVLVILREKGAYWHVQYWDMKDWVYPNFLLSENSCS
jgi:hypothetical protein